MTEQVRVPDTLQSRRLRFVPAELRPLGDGETLLTTPSGEHYRIAAGPERVRSVLTRFDGVRGTSSILADPAVPNGFAAVVEVLAEAGCLVPGPASATPDDVPRTGELLLTGDPDLLAVLRPLLRARCRELPCDAVSNPDTLLTGDAAGDAPGDAADAADVVVVAVRRRPDVEWLTALDDACAAAGIRWTQFHLDGGRAFWGPAVVPDRTARYRDVLARRRCAVDEPEVFDALVAAPLDDPVPPAPADLTWLLAGFAADLERWLDADESRAFSVEIEADPRTLALTPHPVLPLPGRWDPARLLISAPRDERLLIDERTGIIQRLRHITHHPDVPSRLRTVQTHNSSMGRIDPEWANDVITGGSTFDDVGAAEQSAIGEAVERYCGNHMGQSELRWGSYHELTAAGEHAVDPQTLVLYSEEMLATPGCPFVPFTRDLPVRWVRGRSLTHDRPVWLPVTLVFVNWIAGELGRHPITNYMNFSGVAAGRSLDAAIVSGLEELVERDATMVWWTNAQPLPAARHTPALDALWDGVPADAGQQVRYVPIPNEFGIPVVAAIVHHRRDGWFTIGFAARPDARQAAVKALTEALTLQEGSRDLAVEDSLIRQAVEWGFASYVGLKPWRADRRYLDDYRDDFRDVGDLMCQQQVFLDPRAVEAVRGWTDVPAEVDLDTWPALPDRTLATYRERLESRGFEICYVDLTTPDVAVAGFRAARVLVPGLVPNFPAAFPMLGTGRVQRVPVELGWRAEALAESDLTSWPIPHA